MHSLNFNLKRNILECSLLLFVGLCSAYITQATSLSPYYFGYLLSILILFLYDLATLKIANWKKINALFFLFFITVSYYIFNSFYTNTQMYILGNIVLLCINQLSTIITYQLCKHISVNKKLIKDCINFFYIFAIIIGFCDFFYRLIHSTRTYSGIHFFYNFKLNSLMFTDSNWTGFIYMIIFAFFIYLRDFTSFISKRKLINIFIIILLTFSRAAIISSIAVLFFSYFKKLPKRKKTLLLFCFSICCIFFISYIFSVFSKDDSFGTKLALFKGFRYYFKHVNFFNLLIGNGTLAASTNMALLGNIGYSAHLYFIIKTLDLGLIGLILDFGYLLIINYLSKNKFLYILLPFSICGLSMCPTNLSMMYVFGGLIIFMEESRRRKQWN